MPKDGTFDWDEVAWRCDTEMLSPEARGIYREILGALYLKKDRSGVITGTREEISRAGRCSAVQVNGTIQELQKHNVADVSERNGIVTIVNRRMKREHELREKARIRVQNHRNSQTECVSKHRRNAFGNASVTCPLISSDKDEKALKSLSSLKEGECKGETSNVPVTQKKHHEMNGIKDGASVLASRSRKLNSFQRDLARRFESALGQQWVNDAGKWVNRIKNKDTFDKCVRVVAEVESAAKESRINTTPAQYAEQLWKEFS